MALVSTWHSSTSNGILCIAHLSFLCASVILCKGKGIESVDVSPPVSFHHTCTSQVHLPSVHLPSTRVWLSCRFLSYQQFSFYRLLINPTKSPFKPPQQPYCHRHAVSERDLDRRSSAIEISSRSSTRYRWRGGARFDRKCGHVSQRLRPVSRTAEAHA